MAENIIVKLTPPSPDASPFVRVVQPQNTALGGYGVIIQPLPFWTKQSLWELCSMGVWMTTAADAGDRFVAMELYAADGSLMAQDYSAAVPASKSNVLSIQWGTIDYRSYTRPFATMEFASINPRAWSLGTRGEYLKVWVYNALTTDKFRIQSTWRFGGYGYDAR